MSASALRVLLLAVAGLFFVIGGYSDANTTEFWGWGFLLMVVALMLADLPAVLGKRRWRR
jgi:drug/metabolite transporter (DMT)-like permease